MAVKTIRAAQFMYYVPTGEQRTRKDGSKEDMLSVRHALHGDKVNIFRDEDIATGEVVGAFEPEEVEQESPVAEPETSSPLNFDSHDSLVEWIQSERPNVQEVLDAADDDPDKAAMLLAAEETATGGQPRKGVSEGLERMMEEE